MMDYVELRGYIDTAKAAFDLMRAAYEALPKGKQREAVEAKLHEAERLMQAADAKLAKELGMRTCDCTFPPTVMLWRESEKAHVCQNPNCGRRREQPGIGVLSTRQGTWAGSRSGWMK
jgi:hypothetical protein